MSDADIHRNVLDNLQDGVLVVGVAGRIETLNPTAERILGLEPGAATGQSFGEMFIAREGFDDFTQLVLDAVNERSVGERRVVEVRKGDDVRWLSVATSYLTTEEDGTPRTLAAIAVFSDITELRDMHERELRMARAVEEQHGRLQDAYRQIEERNAALAAALRKVRVVQGLGMVLVIVLFLGAGLWTWRPLDLFAVAPALGNLSGTARAQGGGPGLRTLTVKHRRASSSITLKGRLSPWREEEVKSPVEGTITAVNFKMGERVAEGQVLLELDLSKLERRYRSRRLAVAKAEEWLETLKNWEKSPEMIKARRSFTKARMSMESRRNKMRKSRFLFEQGLIAATEFEDQERQHKSEILDFEAAQDEFAAVRAKAGERALAAAELSLQNARAEMLAAGEALRENAVRAPFSGTILPPARAGKDLVEGGRLRKGDPLFRIGDFSRIAAAATTDEIDVVKLEAGQRVTATGNAFPGLTLRGVVDSVSAEADPKQTRRPVFHVSFLLDKLKPAAQARIRPGMSGKFRVVTYDNPKALLVPLDAVRRRGRKHWLRVLDPASGEIRSREVAIGPTTLRRVEITSGLKPGDTVVLAGG